MEPLSASVDALPPEMTDGDVVEVAGADLALVAGGGVALGLQRELALLQLDVAGHVVGVVGAGQLEHRQR